MGEDAYAELEDAAVIARAAALGVPPPKVVLSAKGALFSAMDPDQAAEDQEWQSLFDTANESVLSEMDIVEPD